MTHLEYIQSKIVSLAQLSEMRNNWREKQKRVVFTNGCFDILHLGHVQYLSKARDLGDILIVGLNTDESVSKIKGPNRPLQNNETRVHVLASLQCIDYVVFFNEETPLHVIETLLPDILTKGSDYSISTIVGADTVLNNGGQVLTIELTDGYSTTKIINKLLLQN